MIPFVAELLILHLSVRILTCRSGLRTLLPFLRFFPSSACKTSFLFSFDVFRSLRIFLDRGLFLSFKTAALSSLRPSHSPAPLLWQYVFFSSCRFLRRPSCAFRVISSRDGTFMSVPLLFAAFFLPLLPFFSALSISNYEEQLSRFRVLGSTRSGLTEQRGATN